jgi:hypothetical protein
MAASMSSSVGELWLVLQQGHCLHDLTALAIAALRYVSALPGLLDGMFSLRAETVNDDNVLTCDTAHHRDTTARCDAIHVHSADATEPYTTAILGTSELQLVTGVPQQRHLWVAIERMLNTIDHALDHKFYLTLDI